MSYPLSEDDRAVQKRAREFVDSELIPWEIEAETSAEMDRAAGAFFGERHA